MNKTALEHFVSELSKAWKPLCSELTLKSKNLLEDLISNCDGEDWVKDLIANKYPAKEIYRSEKHGFVLMGHVEDKDVTSPPHDHGNGWVIYSTLTGSVEMGLFNRLITPSGELNVVQKDLYTQSKGESNIYLEGDIHDTKALEDNTVMLRLTSCDFMEEIKSGRLVNFTNYEKW